MKTQALVVSDDAAYHDWLQRSAPDAEFSLVRAASVDEVLDHIHGIGRVDVVFFEFDDATAESRSELVEGLLARVPDLPVAGLGHGGNSRLMQRAMRAGARDFFIPGQDEENLASLLRRLVRRQSPSQGGRQGRVFGVLAALPYDGIAFLAEHIALACKERVPDGGRVLLVDVATPSGAANIFLNLAQGYGVLDAINDGTRCDETLVDTAFARHASGVYVLSLPEDILVRPHIDGEELVSLLTVLRGLFACVVVAFDGHLPVNAIGGLISLCDSTLFLSDQSILKSRHSKYLLRAMRVEGVPLERTQLVVDNYRKRVGLEPANLSELLELPVQAVLSSSADNRILAMNQGEPLFACAPKDEYCAGVRSLAARLMGGESSRPVAKGGGLLGKWLNG